MSSLTREVIKEFVEKVSVEKNYKLTELNQILSAIYKAKITKKKTTKTNKKNDVLPLALCNVPTGIPMVPAIPVDSTVPIVATSIPIVSAVANGSQNSDFSKMTKELMRMTGEQTRMTAELIKMTCDLIAMTKMEIALQNAA